MSPRLNPNFSYIDFGVTYIRKYIYRKFVIKRNHVPHVRESISTHNIPNV